MLIMKLTTFLFFFLQNSFKIVQFFFVLSLSLSTWLALTPWLSEQLRLDGQDHRPRGETFPLQSL